MQALARRWNEGYPVLIQAIPEKLAVNHGGETASAVGARWAETFELHGGLRANSTVLDIGCGPGRMAAAIAERFACSTPSYVGFDILKTDIDWCEVNIARDHPNFRFVHLDIFNAHYNPGGSIDPTLVRFPADSGSCDFIFATSVFTHMRTAETLVYFNEVVRCLAAGGSLLATFFCLEETFLGRMPEGRDFSTRVDDQCFTATPGIPEDAIAYRTAFLMDSLRSAGLTPSLYRGGWSKLLPRTGRHQQDYIVATKPAS